VQKYLQGEDIILWQTEELIIHGIFFLAGWSMHYCADCGDENSSLFCAIENVKYACIFLVQTGEKWKCRYMNLLSLWHDGIHIYSDTATMQNSVCTCALHLMANRPRLLSLESVDVKVQREGKWDPTSYISRVTLGNSGKCAYMVEEIVSYTSWSL
jgi:hypothetical protein